MKEGIVGVSYPDTGKRKLKQGLCGKYIQRVYVRTAMGDRKNSNTVEQKRVKIKDNSRPGKRGVEAFI